MILLNSLKILRHGFLFFTAVPHHLIPPKTSAKRTLKQIALICYNTPMMNDETTEDNDDEDKDRLISMPEAAKLYGFNPVYLTQLASKGRLNARKMASIWVTTPNDVEEYIRSRKKRGSYRDDIQVDN